MGDSIEDARRLAIKLRAKQDQEKASKEEWCSRIPHFSELVAAMIKALNEEGIREVFPQAHTDQLFVAFRDRGLKLAAGADAIRRPELPHEKGATAVFYWSPHTCRVHGFRRPFYLEAEKGTPLKKFVDLGEPKDVTDEALGRAVLEFVEWAAVGEGRNSGKTDVQ